MIRGIKTDTNTVQDFLLEGQRTLNLPNGTWRFHAVAYLDTFREETTCGSSQQRTLEGSDVTIDITLSSERCGQAPFSTLIDEIRLAYFVTVPDPPVVGSFNYDEGVGELLLDWASPSFDGGAPVESFKIEQRFNGGQWQLVDQIDYMFVNYNWVPDYGPGIYEVRVFAQNLKGDSSPSVIESVSVETGDPPPQEYFAETLGINNSNFDQVIAGQCFEVEVIGFNTTIEEIAELEESDTLTLTGDPEISFYAESNCATPESSPTFPAGNSSMSFFLMTTNAGTGEFTLTSANFGPIATQEIIVAAGSADRVEIVDLAGGTYTAGDSIALSAIVVDQYSNIVTTFNDQITLSLSNDPVGATLYGGSAVATAGEVSFDFTVEMAGSGFTVVASGLGLSDSTESNSFDITPAPLEFLNFSSANIPDSELDENLGPIIISGTDLYGNFVPNFSISAGISDDPTLGIATLSGSTSILADPSGIATFNDLSISTAGGEGFSLIFEAEGQTLFSNLFNIDEAQLECDPVEPYFGSGTLADPYRICSIDHLRAIGASDAHFLLTEDLDLQGEDLSTQDYRIHDFFGTFDGNHKTISNITIDTNVTTYGAVGFIDTLEEGAIIKNLIFSNVSISSASASADFLGLIGWNDGGEIENVIIDTIFVSGPADSSVGALVGTNDGQVIRVGAIGVDINGGSASYVGGLVGWNEFGSIAESFAMGTVTGYEAGGLVGHNESFIETSYASVLVESTEIDGSAGGLVGWDLGGTITQSHSTSAPMADNGFLGGLIGLSTDTILTQTHWNSFTSDVLDATSAGTPSGVTALTDTQYTEALSFIDWIFTAVEPELWYMDANYGPRLEWARSFEALWE